MPPIVRFVALIVDSGSSIDLVPTAGHRISIAVPKDLWSVVWLGLDVPGVASRRFLGAWTWLDHPDDVFACSAFHILAGAGFVVSSLLYSCEKKQARGNKRRVKGCKKAFKNRRS